MTSTVSEFPASERVDHPAPQHSIPLGPYGALLAALPALGRSPSDPPLERRAAMLAGLPALLAVARAIVLMGFGPCDEEASALRRRIEACIGEIDDLLRLRGISPRKTDDDVGPLRRS